MGNMILGFLGGIANILGGAVSSSLKLLGNLVTMGFKMTLQYHQKAIAFSREVGMSAKQAQAYTQVLTERAADLGKKYGIAADAVTQLERNLAKATGRVMILTRADTERMVQINKLIDPETANKFTEEIMRGMGGQLTTVQGAIAKTYATAAKKGLDAKAMSDKVAQNLSMANRLTFRNGVDGVSKMVALSEKFSMNMQSIESAANKFMDLTDAIETSAKLSMLGGAAGAFGGNPLDVSYEANYDPEVFADRLTKMLGGYATFDKNTGIAKVNAMSRDFIKGIGDALGIGLEEATKIAKKQAEIKYKESAFGGQRGNYSDDEWDYILNKSYVDTNTGHLMMTGANGQEVDVSKGELSKEMLEEMRKFNDMSDKEILEKQAITLTSIQEMLEGTKTSASGMMAREINTRLPAIQGMIGKATSLILNRIPDIAKNVGKLIDEVVSNEDGILAAVKLAVNGITGLSSFITKNWWTLLAAMAFGPMMGKLGKLLARRAIPAASPAARGSSWLGRGLRAAGRGLRRGASAVGRGLASGARFAGRGLVAGAKGVSNMARGTAGNLGAMGAYGRYVRQGYSELRANGRGRFKSFVKAFNLPKVDASGGIHNQLGHFMGKVGANKAKSRLAEKIIKGGNLAKKFAKTGGVGLVAGLAGDFWESKIEDRVASGKLKAGGTRHVAESAGANALKGAALGATIGSIIPGIGTGIGAAIGGVAGGIKGAYDAWKSNSENANKGVLDFASASFKKIGGKVSETVSSVVGGIKDWYSNNSQTIKQIFNFVTAPIRAFIASLKGIAKAIWHPFDTIKSAFSALKKLFTNPFGDTVSEVARRVGNFMVGRSQDDRSTAWNNKKTNTGATSQVNNTKIESAQTVSTGGIIGDTDNSNVTYVKAIESHSKGGVVGDNNYNTTNSVTYVKAAETHANGGVVGESVNTTNNTNNNNSYVKAIESHSKGGVVGDKTYNNGTTFVRNVETHNHGGIVGDTNNTNNSNVTYMRAIESHSKGGVIGDTNNNSSVSYVKNIESHNNGGVVGDTNNARNSNVTYLKTIESHSKGGVIGDTTNVANSTINNASSNVVMARPSVEKHAEGGVVGTNIDNSSNVTVLKAMPESQAIERHSTGGVIGNSSSVDNLVQIPQSANIEKHKFGGIVGGNDYHGDRILTRLDSGEMVLNRTQQSNLLSLLSNPPVQAKPVGGKEYIYVPTNNGAGNGGTNEVVVRDFNVNIGGTIKIDGGNNSKDVDIRELLNDVSFISKLKEFIKESMASDINGGRVMNDTAWLRGMPSQSTTIGKMTWG